MTQKSIQNCVFAILCNKGEQIIKEAIPWMLFLWFISQIYILWNIINMTFGLTFNIIGKDIRLIPKVNDNNTVGVIISLKSNYRFINIQYDTFQSNSIDPSVSNPMLESTLNTHINPSRIQPPSTEATPL